MVYALIVCRILSLHVGRNLEVVLMDTSTHDYLHMIRNRAAQNNDNQNNNNPNNVRPTSMMTKQ